MRQINEEIPDDLAERKDKLDNRANPFRWIDAIRLGIEKRESIEHRKACKNVED